MERIASLDNIEAAVRESLRNRSKKNALSRDSRVFEKEHKRNVALIREALLSGNMPAIHYNTFRRREHKKDRKIDWNPSFRDNVIQHAIVRVVGPLLTGKMIPDTYSGIKGRGPSYGLRRLRAHIRRFDGRPLYALKFDVHHYYPSIDTFLLKKALRKYIKSEGLLRILDFIVDSHPDGLPIGNYISQLLANIYFTELDPYVRRELRLTVLRYCDDVLILADSKERLWDALEKVKAMLRAMGLSVKGDLQVFPVERHGIDFMGFVVRRRTVLLRKRIERSFRSSARKFRASPSEKTYSSLASYYGWTKSVSRGGLLWKRVVGKPLKTCLEEAKEVA